MADDQETFDPKRRLCPDGTCVGVIGSDGRCAVCGTPDPDGAAVSTDAGMGGDDTHGEPGDEDRGAERGTGDAASGFDPSRRLCVDDTCIGVIGEDNRCSECGKPPAS